MIASNADINSIVSPTERPTQYLLENGINIKHELKKLENQILQLSIFLQRKNEHYDNNKEAITYNKQNNDHPISTCINETNRFKDLISNPNQSINITRTPPLHWDCLQNMKRHEQSGITYIDLFR